MYPSLPAVPALVKANVVERCVLASFLGGDVSSERFPDRTDSPPLPCWNVMSAAGVLLGMLGSRVGARAALLSVLENTDHRFWW